MAPNIIMLTYKNSSEYFNGNSFQQFWKVVCIVFIENRVSDNSVQMTGAKHVKKYIPQLSLE